MFKRIVIILALVTVVALPFILRPSRAQRGPVDETLVIITPHNEAIRSEFGYAFSQWYFQQTGRRIAVDWRVIGGTSEITRYLEGEYAAAFQLHWTRTLGKPWSNEVLSAFHNGKLPANASAIEQEARAEFLRSEVSCGIDLFFGGGPYDFSKQAQAGHLVDCGVIAKHPEWFRDDVIPQRYAGEEYWDPQGRWIGTVLSSYGMIANSDALRRLGLPTPRTWSDLRDPRLVGELALSDPTKSSSIAKAFENMLQQQMQLRWQALKDAQPSADPRTLEAQAVREGWLAGLQLLQRMGANARYFTDTSQKPPIDVAQGNSAVGVCIDFYGRQQAESVGRRDTDTRLTFTSPVGGTVSSVDPIALMRGAKNRSAAVLFIEYVLSMEGQQLWNFRAGTPGGPKNFALRRIPVRRDFFRHAEFIPLRSDPDVDPFAAGEKLTYRVAWTGGLFREMAFIIRVMCLDTHPELTRAWRAIIAADMPADALAVMTDLSSVDYAAANGRIKQLLNSKNKVDELHLANELARDFRARYERAEALARAAKK